MNEIQKVAIFLLMIGFKKASGIIALMDNDEIQKIVPKIDSLVEVSAEVQAKIWAEFLEFGYNDEMSSPDVLTVIRMLCGGSKIGETDSRKTFQRMTRIH